MDDAVRAEILELLSAGIATEQIAQQLGVPRGTVAAVKAHLKMGSYGGSPLAPSGLTEADVDEIEDAANLKFGLERDMQDAPRRNIGQLDPTLRIVDDGKERRVEAGLIDILAEDQEGARVVIELKSGEAPETAITQLLAYIGSLQVEDASRPVRGMLIARSFSTRVRLAARAAEVQLVEYGFSFSFRVVGADGGAVGRPAKRSSGSGSPRRSYRRRLALGPGTKQ
jgi:DNA-binding NarL/FixJ family response regulator